MLPLGVEVGLKAPQAAAGVQLQFTPPAAESFCTIAATLAVPPVPSTAAGIVESVTEMGGGGGGPTCELPPPHPEMVATTPMARSKFLFTAPSEKRKILQSVGRVRLA
jgi:hypothetical protein